MRLFTEASVAIDGSKSKAVNNRDKNFTRAKMERRMAQIEESVARYLQQLDSADRQEPSLARATKTTRLKEKIAKLSPTRAHGPLAEIATGLSFRQSVSHDQDPQRTLRNQKLIHIERAELLLVSRQSSRVGS